MEKSIDNWVDEFRNKEIPVLRKTAKEFQRMSSNTRDLTPSRIAAVVYRDPLMTLRILRFINGMHRGRLAGEVTTIEHAIMMLGIDPFFKQFSQLTFIDDHLGYSRYAFVGLMRVISRAHHAAYQAWDWAVLRNDVKAEEVYTGTLVQSLGEQMFWCFAPEVHLDIVKSMRQDKLPFIETQKALLGFEFSQFQMALARAWNLPELYIDFMDPENSERPRVIDIRLADSIARRSDRGWYQEALWQDMKDVALLLRMEEEPIIARIHQNAIIAARQWELYGVTPAAAWLPLLPGTWPEDEIPDEIVPTAIESDEEALCFMPQPAVMKHVMQEIGSHLDGTFNLQQLMALVLKGMHDGIGLNRVVFALMTPDRKSVKAKFVLGAEANSPLRQFEYSLSTPHLFTRLMSKQQGLWFNASNKEKFAPLLPAEIIKIIGEGEFFAMAVHIHDKPVGMFYADRKHGDCELDAHSYEEFKALCLRASEGLAHLAKK
ncbi:HDOD domain-containing protein [Sulfurirhabdus autotrophica]|uniref:HD-like signal output (HDOD) protein n=1 Tax=Sulfurirhabdus autotrophica TaxID=1706046 RepID=A0A4R3YCL3_9PROT|nr:HDOD domain-containing protein [Sulfurirhabdus autotrophica]TCV90195.1 HD-like signal output (HDOD) protein [Sulfurirhabdus autotrophica]